MASVVSHTDSPATQARATWPVLRAVGAHGRLRPHGRYHTGLCPFHRDARRPSLVVFPATDTWKCYTCNAHDDGLDFLARQTGRPFRAIIHDTLDGAPLPAPRLRWRMGPRATGSTAACSPPGACRPRTARFSGSGESTPRRRVGPQTGDSPAWRPRGPVPGETSWPELRPARIPQVSSHVLDTPPTRQGGSTGALPVPEIATSIDHQKTSGTSLGDAPW